MVNERSIGTGPLLRLMVLLFSFPWLLPELWMVLTMVPVWECITEIPLNFTLLMYLRSYLTWCLTGLIKANRRLGR